jgi:hypothetical protein
MYRGDSAAAQRVAHRSAAAQRPGTFPPVLLACALTATVALSVGAVPGFAAEGLAGWLAAAAGGIAMAALILAEYQAADRGGRVPLLAPLACAFVLALGDAASVHGAPAKTAWIALDGLYVAMLGLARRRVLKQARTRLRSTGGPVIAGPLEHVGDPASADTFVRDLGLLPRGG